MNKHCDQIFQPQPGDDNQFAFVGYLECLAGFLPRDDGAEVEREPKNADRAALAKLRRTLGKKPDEAIEAFPYVVRWAQQARVDWNDEWHEQCYYLVAALFALYPTHGWRRSEPDLKPSQRNFGASFLRLDEEMRKHNQTDERSKSLERRFTALLMSRRDDLPERLRHAVRLLESYKVPIDWVQLLNDLRWWGNNEQAYSARRPVQSVQRRWANSFWRITSQTEAETSAENLTNEADNN